MKKIICILLVQLMLLSSMAGCAAAPGNTDTEISLEGTPTVFTELTGIPLDKTVMKVGSREISAEQFFYWVCYVCGSLEHNMLSDYNSYGMYGSYIDRDTMKVQWDSDYNGVPLVDYALSEAKSTIRYYISIEEAAEKLGVTLTDTDRKAMKQVRDQAVKEMGGEKTYPLYLQMLGVSEETFERISAYPYLYNELLNLVFQEGSPLYLADEDYNNYATYADQILIATQNMQSGEKLPPDAYLEKYNLAEDLLKQLQSAADPIATFQKLADEYSEDPGRVANPNGYVYTPGTMVGEFESAAAALEPGQISDLVQSDYGFHIILRKDLMEVLNKSEDQKKGIAREYLDDYLAKQRAASEVEYDSCLKDINWSDFYIRYTAVVDKLMEQMPGAAEK